jgi:hypothetical protein
VSEGIKREYGFTVRLSPAEKAALAVLAARFKLDQSATVRKALQLALAAGGPLPRAGRFVPLPAGNLAFPVRLSRKAAHGE